MSQIVDNKFFQEYLNTHEEVKALIMVLYSYEQVLNNESDRNLFFASLISADNIVDVESCEISIKTFKFIKEYLDYMHICDDDKKKILKFANKGTQIVKNDLKKFKEQNIHNVGN